MKTGMSPDIACDSFLPAMLALEDYIYRNNFRGWEPYDGLNTRYGFLKTSKTSRLIVTHLNKISPINLRRILGVDKFHHTKALALLLSAYCNLYELTKNLEYRRKYLECRDLLLGKELPDGGLGGSYDYQMRNWLARKDGLSTLSTMLAVKGLAQGYSCFGYEEDLVKARQYVQIILDRHVARNNGHIRVTYAEGQPRPILNVYAITAGTLSVVYAANSEQSLIDLAREILGVVLSQQFENGAWPFVAGEDYDSTQIDFHQGFILEGISEYLHGVPLGDVKIKHALEKGCEFYWQHLFSPEGCSNFRLRHKHPADIQNQAEGIVSFTECASFVPEAIRYAQSVAEWTIGHMYKPKEGLFVYQIWPFLTNRIAYMAWGQASMLMALSRLALQRRIIEGNAY